MTTPHSKLLVITGPTASGKTERGLDLARGQNGEIVSVDSRQIYRFLSIGTAKPEGKHSGKIYEVEGIPYHLVDFVEPDQRFSAADFVQLAEEKIEEIRQRGKRPILVGGTGLYLKALFEGLAPIPAADLALREELTQRAEREGRTVLHRELAAVDPIAAASIPPNNIHRVMRALEIFMQTGKPMTVWHREHPRKNPEAHDLIVMDPGVNELKERIEKRCRAMLQDGLIEETKALLKRGFSKECPALSGLGYPRVVEYLDGRLSREELLNWLISDTRQYAKRQRTWFRHQLKTAPMEAA